MNEVNDDDVESESQSGAAVTLCQPFVRSFVRSSRLGRVRDPSEKNGLKEINHHVRGGVGRFVSARGVSDDAVIHSSKKS